MSPSKLAASAVYPGGERVVTWLLADAPGGALLTDLGETERVSRAGPVYFPRAEWRAEARPLCRRLGVLLMPDGQIALRSGAGDPKRGARRLALACARIAAAFRSERRAML